MPATLETTFITFSRGNFMIASAFIQEKLKVYVLCTYPTSWLFNLILRLLAPLFHPLNFSITELQYQPGWIALSGFARFMPELKKASIPRLNIQMCAQ